VDHYDNGHDLFGVGPTVELVPASGNGSGHALVSANGNGHHEEPEEPQQSLFSWAEFMAEPVKPKGRKTKAEALSLSVFKWAVEQKRGAEPVGAGR